MTVTCPACDEELDVLGGQVLAVGDQIQCDECGELLEVSELAGGDVSAVESTPGTCDTDEDLDEDEDSDEDDDEYEGEPGLGDDDEDDEDDEDDLY